MCDWIEKILRMNYVGKIIRFIAALTLEIYLVGFVLCITSLAMFKKITSAENLRSRAFDDLAIELNINCNRKIAEVIF